MQGSCVCEHFQFLLLVFGHFGDFKVDEFESAWDGIIKDVFRFEVSMAAAFLMQVWNDVKNGLDDFRYDGLKHLTSAIEALIDKSAQLWEFAELQDEVARSDSFVDEEIVSLDDTRMVEAFQDSVVFFGSL